MKEVILCKYGEIVLKGNNRNQFESLLMKELRRRAADLGKYDIRYMQSTVYIEPADEEAEMNFEEMYARCGKIFGFVGLCRAVACEKTLDAILETAKAYLPEKLRITVILYFFRDMDMAETAQALHVPVGAVKSRLHQARKRLKEVLGDGPDV